MSLQRTLWSLVLGFGIGPALQALPTVYLLQNASDCPWILTDPAKKRDPYADGRFHLEVDNALPTYPAEDPSGTAEWFIPLGANVVLRVESNALDGGGRMLLMLTEQRGDLASLPKPLTLPALALTRSDEAGASLERPAGSYVIIGHDILGSSDLPAANKEPGGASSVVPTLPETKGSLPSKASPEAASSASSSSSPSHRITIAPEYLLPPPALARPRPAGGGGAPSPQGRAESSSGSSSSSSPLSVVSADPALTPPSPSPSPSSGSSSAKPRKRTIRVDLPELFAWFNKQVKIAKLENLKAGHDIDMDKFRNTYMSAGLEEETLSLINKRRLCKDGTTNPYTIKQIRKFIVNMRYEGYDIWDNEKLWQEFLIIDGNGQAGNNVTPGGSGSGVDAEPAQLHNIEASQEPVNFLLPISHPVFLPLPGAPSPSSSLSSIPSFIDVDPIVERPLHTEIPMNRNTALPSGGLRVLVNWIEQNSNWPYANQKTIRYLASKARISDKQVAGWIRNFRKRKWKINGVRNSDLIVKKYLAELKAQAGHPTEEEAQSELIHDCRINPSTREEPKTDSGLSRSKAKRRHEEPQETWESAAQSDDDESKGAFGSSRSSSSNQRSAKLTRKNPEANGASGLVPFSLSLQARHDLEAEGGGAGNAPQTPSEGPLSHGGERVGLGRGGGSAFVRLGGERLGRMAKRPGAPAPVPSRSLPPDAESKLPLAGPSLTASGAGSTPGFGPPSLPPSASLGSTPIEIHGQLDPISYSRSTSSSSLLPLEIRNQSHSSWCLFCPLAWRAKISSLLPSGRRLLLAPSLIPGSTDGEFQILPGERLSLWITKIPETTGLALALRNRTNTSSGQITWQRRAPGGAETAGFTAELSLGAWGQGEMTVEDHRTVVIHGQSLEGHGQEEVAVGAVVPMEERPDAAPTRRDKKQ